ncbi:hypothetical protein JF770_15030 [Mycobacterium intracellulare]|uniref:hypothetical protein n=1 Tax=Mycobacterium intracellulare TaxID=1767 RepID=UPI001CD944A3|nr:hypothetical protein [Mycobacterium intracellulare]MCA2304879.1 hypothetical protein [Mycobacterium intracellulare]MCA2347090.1 hypothetical protein [Mycobacterium intracellulare]
MSDEPGSDLHVRQAPRNRTTGAQMADFTTLVRVPGQPGAARVYTDNEQDEAARYASQSGGAIVPLPLSPPTGYAPDETGSLMPDHVGRAGSETNRVPA